VNGRGASDLYKLLTKDGSEKIEGDWTKFLIDDKGIPFKRYEPWVEPKELLPIIFDYFKDDYPEK
jgi:glutathione peroxidase-family protein